MASSQAPQPPALWALSVRTCLSARALTPGAVANASRQKRLRLAGAAPLCVARILDINGNVMARTVQRYNLTADQSAVATFKRYNEDRTQKIEVTPNQLVYEMVDILKTVDPGITDEFIKSKLDGTSKYSVIKANITPEIFNKIDALGAPSSTVRRSPSVCTPTVVWVAPWRQVQHC